jgi:hypothetical protein
MGVLHTPDFFVIRENEAGWEEWKTEEDLGRLSERNSNRYCCSPAGQWRCPPGVAYAESLGLYYRVRSSLEIDWVFQRNIQFLDDYLRAESLDAAPASRDIAIACLTATPGLSLADLLQLTKDKVAPDDIYAMIAADILHIDWRAAPLAEPSRVKVFSTLEAIRQHQGSRKPELPPMVRLKRGSEDVGRPFVEHYESRRYVRKLAFRRSHPNPDKPEPNRPVPSDENWELGIERWSDLSDQCSIPIPNSSSEERHFVPWQRTI